ncbi:hypothetical protein T8J41_19555 (plasmid) [Nitratireductor rhodophyticola]|uniref:TetR transcriptional regulator CgmR-like C-terminal domain-containing protein n=1 Tax=Nitratireductor rhodophyticola TaxID=2854036 RepID=A0ABS7RH32_9HYPH|nr:hypothetical protein [Nitratireductor rhodophyticola]MBY8918953.1 hypothetical protein [Nitratireductor rhodophyticola]MBY8922992.1 hypothetical protein [Nitratireductor rhodophyticola]MEC9246130.1 hypothetical protein [Pseudomonadota bacterium]WPZ16392.1 hypothetical protein T8J41_19555 [Nitratireductor rhodophyticola]
MQRLCDRFEVAQLTIRSERSTPADRLKAYVIATFTEDDTTRDVAAGLLAVAANDLGLLKDVHEHQRPDLDGLVQSSGTQARGRGVAGDDRNMAAGILKTSPLAADRRQKVLEELLRLANGIGDEQQAPPQS